MKNNITILEDFIKQIKNQYVKVPINRTDQKASVCGCMMMDILCHTYSVKELLYKNRVTSVEVILRCIVEEMANLINVICDSTNEYMARLYYGSLTNELQNKKYTINHCASILSSNNINGLKIDISDIEKEIKTLKETSLAQVKNQKYITTKDRFDLLMTNIGEDAKWLKLTYTWHCETVHSNLSIYHKKYILDTKQISNNKPLSEIDLKYYIHIVCVVLYLAFIYYRKISNVNINIDKLTNSLNNVNTKLNI